MRLPDPREHPVVAPAPQCEVGLAVGGFDAEHRLVLLLPGPVDDLHQRQLADRDAGPLALELAPHGLFEPGPVPALVLGVGGRERTVGGAYLGAEAAGQAAPP